MDVQAQLSANHDGRQICVEQSDLCTWRRFSGLKTNAAKRLCTNLGQTGKRTPKHKEAETHRPRKAPKHTSVQARASASEHTRAGPEETQEPHNHPLQHPTGTWRIHEAGVRQHVLQQWELPIHSLSVVHW